MDTLNKKNKIPLFQRMAEFFFIIYLITLYVFVDRLETLTYSNIAFVLFAGCSVLTLLQRKRFYIGKNVMLTYVCFTWMQATTFWASNTYLAGDRMKTMWLLFVLFFIVYNLFYEKEDAHAFFIKSFYIAGIALIGYSINEYGISEVFNMMTMEFGVRLGAEINQENTFGMFNATTIILAFYYLLHKKTYKIFHIAVIAGAFLFAMSSGSRKAMLMMCIGVLMIIYRRYGIKKLYKVIAVAAVLVLLFMAIIQLPAFDYIRNRMDLTFGILTGESTGDSSSRLRSKLIDTGWELFKDRMLTGYGANNFAAISGYRTYSHNNFIEILVNFGLVGFVLYYVIYLMAFCNLWKEKNPESQVVMIVMLVRVMMEVAVVSYYGKILWIILAFALAGTTNEGTTKEQVEQEEDVLPCKESCKKKNEDIYETERIDCKNKESVYEPQDSDFVPVGEGEYCQMLFGQSVSENEVLGDNGEETQS